PVERFETRSFMQYLMDIEDEKGRAAALEEYRMEKELAVEYYHRTLSWLRSNRADQGIINWKTGIIGLWENGLENHAALEKLYALESLRSYILDIHDDVGGRSCTLETLKKADRVISAFESGAAALSGIPALSWGDEKLDRAELVYKYRRLREKAVEYQIC
ncbi:MAG TPA: phosphotransferase, partial [Candidatus Wallbacteria bacterium]|nr:phosphotransferase [Candidatus Wallbacteria bacterium]